MNILVSFGQRDRHLPGKRLTLKENGGGTVLDYGVYCIQFILNAFGGARPAKIVANTVGLNSNGVDQGLSVTLHFDNGRMATFATELRVELPNEAHIVATKGSIKVLKPFHSPTKMVLESVDSGNNTEVYPLPEGPFKHPFQIPNGQGLIYEAEEVRKCILKGHLESPVMTWEDTIIVAEIQQEIHRQIGVDFSCF